MGGESNLPASEVRDSEIAVDPGRAEDSPIFVAGADRSGTTLMFALLAAHSNLSMTRRSNMFRYFYKRYGDLDSDENMDRCISAMVSYQKMGHLNPNLTEIRDEFMSGPRGYARLFSIFHSQHARRSGKMRWGDKSLHNELFAGDIFEAFPNARIIHMVRDPRDRYASVSKRHGKDVARVGPASARWTQSIRAGLRNLARHDGKYVFVRYEDLVSSPKDTITTVCTFINVEFEPAMLGLGKTPDVRDGASNSSFGDLGDQAISTRAVGRFQDVLRPEDLRFIQWACRRGMERFGYPLVDVDNSETGRLVPAIHTIPSAARMWGWTAVARIARLRGPRIPAGKVLDSPVPADPTGT